eukprot:TRINITY_DN125_c0_g1_i8.p1 TRINITY_DN125_c0_g1~~TRINITY_DN125_c0_g1_i8.p1  ORF type:complete len:258 (+),score=32.88 TRINITY_DN125_c0_g1_i8:2-775(+)
MNSLSLIAFLCITISIACRDLSSFFVGGQGSNIGSAFAQTEFTTPVYTPGTTAQAFDTLLETNFTTGFGRFQGYRNTAAQTAGPGQQVSGGLSNIISQLGTGGIFSTGGVGNVQGSSGSVGVNGTIGATFTNTTNRVISLTGPTTPQGSYARTGGSTGAIRSGFGQVFSQMANQAATYAVDAADNTVTASDSRGASSATITGNDVLSFATGDTFSVSGSEETVTGCQQSAGAASYGDDVGQDGYAIAACSSRGSFQG